MRYFIVIFSLTVLLSSCAPSAKKKAEEISTLEITILSATQQRISDTVGVKKLLAQYDYFIEHFPTDSLAPQYLIKSAKFYAAIDRPDREFDCYQRLCTTFPTHPNAELGLFMQGYLLENSKHDLDKAKAAYNSYLTKFPAGKWAQAVRFSLDHLGKTPEQIAAEFDSINKNKVDTLSKVQ